MKKTLITLVIIIIAVSGFYIYSNAKEDDGQEKQTAKIESEIDYLDTKITTLINNLNGIELQNYKITLSKTQQEKSDASGKERW